MTSVPTKWRKSSYSAEETDCVELTYVDRRVAALRDSKNPTGPTLKADIATLLGAVKSDRLSC